MVADAAESAPATVVEGTATPEHVRSTGKRALGLMGGAALLAAVVLGGAALPASNREPAAGARTVEPPRLEPKREPLAEPRALPAVVLSPAPPPVLAAATSAPHPSPAPVAGRKPRAKVSVAPAPVVVGDGRALFNDTK